MLDISVDYPIRIENGGLFISRGLGHHPTRILESYELIFVEQGILAISEDQHDFHVKAGESLLLWPGRKHEGIGNFPPDLKFYWLHFGIIAARPAIQDALKLPIPQYSKIRDPHRFITLFRLFLSEQENRSPPSSLELILLLLLQQVADGWTESTEPAEPGMALAWKAQQLIGTQFHLPLTASGLAAQLFCNADYLGRVFKMTFRMTLTEAIHRRRIGNAEKMLVADCGAIADIAKRCGFPDVAYFRRLFRRLTGLTPLEYKKRYCKEHVNSDIL
ncbi:MULTISPECIES: helix-turn-helix domain-containing protein [Sodalis]|jgi:AraC-like DNA-binding protein|uniref:Arabinose operon regulatory protein n=1 Tax=Sodalis ligni TaxID=2697027 RepID=A0A4R1NMU3_9GAMM|nr:AraC family transcriptional regulator [Sodalis ligni]TCL06046.1 AraC-like DNA-binding protein [Sodalis ligni]